MQKLVAFRIGNRTPVVAALLGCLLATALPASAGGQQTDCAGPAGEASPGTPEWERRDADNVFCAKQRHDDQTRHPVSPLPSSTERFGVSPLSLADAYREPSRHDDGRFRFDRITIENRDGEPLAAELYRPCAPGACRGLPPGLRPFRPRYPAVAILHGGGSRKELHWWSSQTLAEAGYMTVAFNGAADNRANAEDVLDWLFATPADRTRAGQYNPHWRELDRRRVGIAGHSRGGQTASVLGQDDPRIRGIVAWDRGRNIPLPKRLDTPTLFFVGDYACQETPVCEPEPYPSPPGGEGPGGRGREYNLVRAAGVDAMKVVLRASTHLDWTPSEPAGNRYAETVSVYYTLSWLDRYVRGAGRPRIAAKAFQRLVAARFDRYADRHNISQGLYDPAAAAADPGDPYAGNVPYEIAGLPVADRYSFYFPSKCFIRAPAGSRYLTENMRSRPCRPAGAPSPVGRRRSCIAARGRAHGRHLGPARLGRRRAVQRRLLRRHTRRSRRGMDTYCVRRGGALAVGYPTRRLSRRQRALARGRAILIVTTSRRFAVRGIRRGARVRTLRRRLRGERRVRVGRTTWYVAPARRARRIYRVRRGRVLAVGLADRRLTRTRRAARRFLGSWRG